MTLFDYRSRLWIVGGRPFSVEMTQESPGYPWQIRFELGKPGQNIGPSPLHGRRVWFTPHKNALTISLSLPLLRAWRG